MIDKEKKYFLSEDSYLDADTASFAVAPNAWVNAQNVRTKSTDKGVTGTVESIGGTLLLSTPLPSLVFIDLGSVEDVANSRFLNFKLCTTGPWHKITCLDTILGQELDVLLASQVEGGFDWDKDFPIHSAYVVDGLLYWTTNRSDPNKINIDAGIKLNNPSYVTDQAAYASPLLYTEVTIIKRPPIFPLEVTKLTDGSYDNNFIYNIAIQATYRYYYRDNEISALAAYGTLAPFNASADTYNAIDLALPFTEYIDDDIQIVELCVKFGNNGGTFAIKSWDKNSAADAAEIAAHNADSTQLTYRFYNDVTGNPLDSVEANAPFHGVPQESLTLAFNKNRLLLGNNLFGYDTPTETSLALTLSDYDTGNAGSYPGSEWNFVTVTYQSNTFPYGTITHVYYYAWNATIPVAAYYAAYGASVSPPLTLNVADATYTGTTEATLGYTLASNLAPVGYHVYYPAGFPVTHTGSTTTLVVAATLPPNLQFFKSSSTYNVSISFFDQYRRKCGVVDVSNKVVIPERTYSQTVFSTTINWTLNNLNTLAEIPDWAYYYQIEITKDLTTRFFVQGLSAGAAYATKDPTTGVISYGTTYNKDTCYALAINLSTLNSAGLGYVYAEGDLARIYNNPVNLNARILGQDGIYVLVSPYDLGTVSLTATQVLYELYTPYAQTIIEPYYETGNVYSIINPTTDGRYYSTLTGTINGDCYAIERQLTLGSTDYFVEAMSPNDLVWQDWEVDRGWVNFIDKIGQARHTSNITWSDVIIPGTKTNGLNVFQPLNRRDLPIECGQLEKLQLTSKVQDEKGVIMLSICEMETASMYMGEAQVLSPVGNAFLATSTDVIGTINVLKGRRGTRHPESVTEYRGNVFWWDDINGRIVQYGSNGLFDISRYKMTRFWKLFTDQFNSMTSEEIEALGGRPFVYMTVDPYHNELLISIPKLLDTPPKGYLPDYPEAIYPFDIWDGQGKTIVYKLDMGEGRPYWMGSYSFNPENFITLNNQLYSFLQGMIYLHNQTNNYNEFYGVQYSSKIMIVSNILPNKPKMYNNIASESNLVPDFVYMYNDYPTQQSSDLVDSDFRPIEGNFYSTIKRNKLVPTEDGYTTDGLLTGGKMRNVAMWVMLEWRVTTTPLELKFVNIGYEVSRGNPV